MTDWWARTIAFLEASSKPHTATEIARGIGYTGGGSLTRLLGYMYAARRVERRALQHDGQNRYEWFVVAKS